MSRVWDQKLIYIDFVVNYKMIFCSVFGVGGCSLILHIRFTLLFSSHFATSKPFFFLPVYHIFFLSYHQHKFTFPVTTKPWAYSLQFHPLNKVFSWLMICISYSLILCWLVPSREEGGLVTFISSIILDFPFSHELFYATIVRWLIMIPFIIKFTHTFLISPSPGYFQDIKSL